MLWPTLSMAVLPVTHQASIPTPSRALRRRHRKTPEDSGDAIMQRVQTKWPPPLWGRRIRVLLALQFIDSALSTAGSCEGRHVQLATPQRSTFVMIFVAAAAPPLQQVLRQLALNNARIGKQRPVRLGRR